MADNYDKLFDDWNDYDLERSMLKGVSTKDIYKEIAGFVSEDGERFETYVSDDPAILETWEKVKSQNKLGIITNEYREWLEAVHIYLFAI